MIKNLWFLIIVLSVATLIRCAHPVTPSGGPKDLTPPEVVKTTPENGTAGFKTNKFSIDFNEFISLENIQQAALISPPMKEFPDYSVKGKSVVVKFNEELKPKTTYSVYFGDAIVDITESNPVSNYTYIFSTGDFVDSLSLTGNVYNAFDLTPLSEIYVMLYKNDNDTITFDSLPYFVVPYYLSKTDVKGRFQFSGLADNEYLLFALNDKNSNYIFDQPGEEIAFLDSLIRPFYIEKPVVDSTLYDTIKDIQFKNDSIIVEADTLLTDSVHFHEENNLDLYMFLSPDTVQRILKAEVIEKNKVRFSFSLPATNVKIESLKYSSDTVWYVVDYSKKKDTIYWYLHNPPIDSLDLLLTQFGDTLGIVYLKLDPQKKLARSRKKDQEPVKDYLGWKSNIKASKLDLNKNVVIQFMQPYVKFNMIDSSLLVIDKDSIWDPEFRFTDSLRMQIEFPFEPREDTRYRIYFPDSAFTNWNNINTKAIDIKFSTLSLSDYGILTFKLNPEKKQNYILQILNDKEIIIRDFYFKNDTSVTFEYMEPAEYHFKLIYDDNKNNEWDTGNFGLKIQPEKVTYYSKTIKVRANWEIEEEWSW